MGRSLMGGREHRSCNTGEQLLPHARQWSNRSLVQRNRYRWMSTLPLSPNPQSPHPRCPVVSPRWRKVLRDLWHNKTRTVLVVLSIAVGVFAVGTIVSTWSMLQHDLAVDYAAIEPSSAIVFAAPFDDALVKQIQRMDDVQSAEGRFNLVVQLRIGSNEWRNLRLEVIDDYAAQQLNKVRSERGAWPPPNRTLLIERASLGLTSASIGDVVELISEISHHDRWPAFGVSASSATNIPLP